MYTLYIANKNYSSWSLRPWVLMRQLGIAFTEKIAPFAEGSNYEAFRSFSPTGKVPCLQGPEGTVWDSLAITEFLAERNSGVWPADSAARAWARCACAEMHSGFGNLRTQCSMNCGIRVELKEINAALQSDLVRLDELWNEGLNRFGGPFLAGGEFSAVDAFFAPVAFRIQTYQLQLSAPAMAYVQRLLALPAMQEWYAAGVAETWREPGHEQDTLQYGRIVSDMRAQ